MEDRALLEAYVRKYGIDGHFSYWEQYDPKLLRFPKGAMVCPPGEALEHVCFLVEGRVSIHIIAADGRFASIGVAEPPQMLGDMECTGRGGLAEAVALTEVVCVAVSLKQYGELLRQDIKFMQLLCETLAKKVVDATGDRYGYHFLTLKQRLSAQLLAEERNGRLQCNWTETAQKLDASYRQLMRVLHGFQEQGFLRREGGQGRYIITDRKALENLAEGL